jgi:hypothetical protein
MARFHAAHVTRRADRIRMVILERERRHVVLERVAPSSMLPVDDVEGPPLVLRVARHTGILERTVKSAMLIQPLPKRLVAGQTLGIRRTLT